MAGALSKRELLERLVGAIQESQARAIVVRQQHPFVLLVGRDERADISACIYVWNITHGGGARRPAHEYRIQLTGVVPATHPGQETFLLGWDEGRRVFAAFDIRYHHGQASASPSIQVPLEALQGAHAHAFASHLRGNNETVVAFKPPFLVEYMLAARDLHGEVSKVAGSRALLNKIDQLSDAQIETVPVGPRRRVLASIWRRYRDYDFRQRVLGAYRNGCAMCGLQLRLVEAAHIVPVAIEGSDDSTSNGIALCANHHKAYDAGLISFDENFDIEVSHAQLSALQTDRLGDGLDSFRESLLPAVRLPSDKRDYPTPGLIVKSRRVRRWKS